MKKLVMLIPDILNSKGNVRIWSAGCSNGAEPFTLAILISELFGDNYPDSVDILATDIDPDNNFEDFFRYGIYDKDRLNRIPEDVCRKYFHGNEDNSGNVVLNDSIIERVEFMRHDLLSGNLPGGFFDIIICKNVLLHFNESEQSEIVSLIYNSMNDNGLFVTEQTHRLPDEWDDHFVRIFPDARIYRKFSEI
ncbi:CheR family methyltransferase [Methanoplanus endosymbiosus]|uniref:CheR-type methyltransferase domain-containing protein n=1 Tax=Methanoplanus endosymbiosus TaxID=33865 RepID=A0A9E7PN50_9EURY|nr:CheR family methyltransferase [Methanoplanus endosymbiosus]UUX93333.1 hypothetical protein L6E24_04190 [Methanoplanus endosymbiosus]